MKQGPTSCKQKQTPLGETFLVDTFFNVSPPCSLAARFLVDPLSDFSLLSEGLFALDAGVGGNSGATTRPLGRRGIVG